MSKVADQRVLVLDFGSQYAQLIARRVREQQVYCEIVRHDLPCARIRELNPRGLILSGGPASVYEKGAPHCSAEVFRLGIPVLGICYGMQEACEALGEAWRACRLGNMAAPDAGSSSRTSCSPVFRARPRCG